MESMENKTGVETLDTTTNTQQEPTQAEIENSALKELLQETKNALQSVQDELIEVKKQNAKMALSMNVAPKVSVDEIIFNSFNKYKK